MGIYLATCKTLSSANPELRKSTKANHVFRNLKCRPNIYHKIRWCGAILILFSNKKAYGNGAYDGEISCQIALAKIFKFFYPPIMLHLADRLILMKSMNQVKIFS